MVVSIDNDATDYYIGAGSLEDAKTCSLNHNPALGRIQMSDYAIYENNASKILDFPLEESKVGASAYMGKMNS